MSLADRQFPRLDLPAERSGKFSVPANNLNFLFRVLYSACGVSIHHVKESVHPERCVMEVRDGLHQLAGIKVLQLLVELAKGFT